jgi:two-component system invasion response regulator UvrY
MKILIADDHAIARKGLISILFGEFDELAITEVAEGSELLKQAASGHWDIIISDISMPGRSGLEILVELKATVSQVPVLVISAYTEEQYAVRAIKAGAAGYLTKHSAADELVGAIRHILGGKKYITPRIAELLADSYSKDIPAHEKLTNREFEILKLLAENKSVSEIGHLLSLSVHTANTYRARILDKMGMTTTAELVHYTISNHLF